jgi:hypothetical protein
MASIVTAARRIKSEGAGFLSEALVAQACVAAGHIRGRRWRCRILTPLAIVQSFALGVLHGNASCRATLRLAGLTCSIQAYGHARMRLPVDVLGWLAARLTHEARRRVANFGRWRGHRVLHVDGTGLSMPDEPVLQLTYGKPGQRNCRKPMFPVMHVLWLFDAATGLIVDFMPDKCRTHDMAHAAGLHALMEDGDVLVGDRAFGSFAHLALLLQRKCHGLFRAHQRQIVSFTPGRPHRRPQPKGRRKGLPTSRWLGTLGVEDQLVVYAKPASRPRWMSQADYDALPDTLIVRELRYRIDRPGFRTQEVTLVTTLIDPRKYPKQDMVELYAARWQIETNLRHLKQTMGMDVLRCKTREGIEKELWMYLIIHNQVRLLMLDAAHRQGVPPDRISFIDALDLWRHQGPDAFAHVPLIVNPDRPGRHQPRRIKRPKDRYSYLTRPRDELQQELGITRLAA